MNESRKYIRFSTSLDAEVKTLTLNPIFGKALAKNLSKEGVRLGLSQPISAGTPIELSLNVPGDNLPVFATGRVAWADGLDIGVKFTKISSEDRTRVLDYVYDEWLRNKKQHCENAM